MVQISIIGRNISDNETNIQNAKSDIAVKSENSQKTYTLEEALEEAKVGKYQVILTMLTGISVLGSALENASIGFILPYAKCDLELTVGEQGLLSGISNLGIALTSHFWGFMSDTWGRQKVLRAAAIGGFIFASASAFAMNTISMLLLRFLAGAFLAGSSSGGYTYISEFHTAGTAARAATFVTIALYSVWVFLSPMAMLIIPEDWAFYIFTLEFKPWRLFLLSTSLINVWNAIALSFAPETPKFLLAMNRKEETLEVLSRIYAVNTGQSRDSYPVKHIENVTLGNNLSNVKGICGFLNLVVKQTKPIFQRPLNLYTWKLCYITFMIFVMGHGAFIWFPEIIVQLRMFDGRSSTLCDIVRPKPTANATEQACNIDNKNIQPFQLLFLIGISFLVMSAIASFSLKKIEPKKLVYGWMLVSTIACILINFLTEFYSTVITYVIFLSVCICSNIVIAITANLFPTNYRGVATAFVLACGRTGTVMGSSIFGFILTTNCNSIFYLFCGVIISCALVFMTIRIKPQ